MRSQHMTVDTVAIILLCVVAIILGVYLAGIGDCC
jgi:hypothetical protein